MIIQFFTFSGDCKSPNSGYPSAHQKEYVDKIAVGTSVGAMVGSALPVIGTVIGSAIGGFIGGNLIYLNFTF